MTKKFTSLIGLAIALAGVFFLVEKKYILSKNPIAIIIQIFSIALMIWARITFGMRSFHAAANTTKGELVTNGPYRWFRHPIYASLIYFFVASIIAFPLIETIGAVILIIAGLMMRMLLEEKFLLAAYDGYAAYCTRTKRIIPFIF